MRVVIPSLRYADYLAVTLPAWLALVPRKRLVVVTAPEDTETAAVAAAHEVTLVVTDAWTRDGAVLNKARALDEAFGFVDSPIRPPSPDETCLALDADVVPFGVLPPFDAIAADTLYGCARYACPTPQALRDHRAGRTVPAQLPLIAPRLRGEPRPQLVPHTDEGVRACGRQCLGYFQLFRWRPGIRFGESRTAAKYDLDFRQHFGARVGLTSIYVLHLGDQSRENWRGRVMPRWEECAS